MSAAPEIARLAETLLLAAAQPAGAQPAGAQPAGAQPAGAQPPTLGRLAGQLRMLAAAPERWWGLVRFNPDRSVTIGVEDHPSFQAWLVVLPPGHPGQDCDCDAATIIAGEATDGAPGSAALRPGAMRVHGQRHRLHGQGTGYSISLHARAQRPVAGARARNSSTRNLEVIG
jgi:hypothetical protein